MDAAAHYRALAAHFRAKARADGDLSQAVEWEHLAQSYLRLAEQAERNAELDLSIEIGPPLRLGDEGSGGDNGQEQT
jgi:hypothetical protein